MPTPRQTLKYAHMYHLIINPVAGRGRARTVLERLKRACADQDLALTLHYTNAPGHATDLVHTLPGDAAVLSVGGDGTLHEVAAACTGTARTVGLVPGGSGDDFAFALGIPRSDPLAALAIIRRGHVREVDTGLVNGQVFINAFGVGFDADVAYGTRHAPAYLRGKAAYYHAVLTTLRRLEAVPVRVVLDGQQVYSGPALLVAAQNGSRTGGSFMFAPEAKLDDGLLDVVIAGSLGKLATLELLPKVIRGRHLGHKEVFTFQGKRLSLRWEKARPGHKEGELLEPQRSFDIGIRPRSLRVFAPQ